MKTHLFYENLIQQMKSLYPLVNKEASSFKKGFSPFTLVLPRSALKDIKKTVKNLELWSQKKPQQEKTFDSSNPLVKNHSVLMTYDFHWTSEGRLKLIEVNTNGSGFLAVDLIQKAHGKHTAALKSLKQSFFNEWMLFKNSKEPPTNTAIVDENIPNQKMEFEFLMYSSLFKEWGWKNQIIEAKDLNINKNGKLIDKGNKEIDFIYNRLTDFYFENWPQINKAYQKQKTCFSPHPKEYAKLADKRNLCLLTQDLKNSEPSPVDKEFLKQILAKTYFMETDKKNSLSLEEAWKNKKKLFFKPLRGFGGKQAYRGQSLTKKKMNEIKNGIAQEYIPAGQWINPLNKEKWKFDIRAYVYQDEVQLAGARFYKGQVTNFSEPFSGYAQVVFQP